jgi:hypothetical protein
VNDRAARVRASFAEQAPTCTRLGSPFMARLMALCAARLAPETAVETRVLDWPGDPRPGADNVSLRLAGGLHALVITGAAPDLTAAYPPNMVDDDILWRAIRQSMDNHPGLLLDWLTRPPQTNEVRRAAAILPALHVAARMTGLPLALWEVGCSAGLALRADRYGLQAGAQWLGPADATVRLAPAWSGPSPPPADLRIVDRRGVDLSPLDPTNPAHRLRLRAYLWPDQPDRRTLTDAAIAVARDLPARIDAGDAVEWLEAHLPKRPPGVATVIFHTIAWQYLPPAARARGDARIAAEGAGATADQPLIRIGMEGDGGTDSALTLQAWPGGMVRRLGRADFHGRTIRWEIAMAE